MKTLLLFAVIAGALGLRRLLRIAGVGAAYKAKALCSALFVSGLDIPDLDAADEVSAEAYRIMRLFGARADREAKSVTASVGLVSRTAVYRPGLGATLAFGPIVSSSNAPVPRRSERPEAPWPEGEALAAAAPATLERVLAGAFVETDGRRKRRTRAVAVVHRGRLIAESYAPGFSASTPLNGWSMTKGVMSALIGTLVGEGKLRLDDFGLLPEWDKTGDPRQAVRLEDLLRMRSGLRFSERYSDPLSDVSRMLFDVGDAGGYAAACPAARPPGTAWQYASGTTNILSLVARRVVGEKRYSDWPRRALFDPLGMSSAVFEPDASGTYVGSSFLFAAARDWARFGLLYARDGVWDGRRILPEGWVKFSTTPERLSPGGCYGAHWWLKISREFGGETPAAGRVPPDAFHAFGHEGQCLTIVPSRDVVIVRLGLSIDVSAWDHAAFVAEVLDAIALGA